MKELKKASIIYLGIGLFTLLFEKIYLSFSHGMSSDAMTHLFLYALVPGCIVYGMLWLVFPYTAKSKYYRLFSNIYNTAIATLMTGLLLKGIFEIAGSSSSLLIVYFGVSYVLFGISIIILLYILISR